MTNRLDEPMEILLVEDNPGDVRLTREAFREVPTDVTLCVCTDGDDALEELRDRSTSDSIPVPDLTLLDLNLPRTNGFEFLEEIQDDPVLARIPVLVLTSSNAGDDILESYELAANAYLTKPTDPAEFSTMVEAVVDFWFRQATLPPATA
ncbi:response regulator [Natrarchaeobius chitinivorans]|uniref:Response regulator n=1 Tax=Natrarchaeobius chitinivorans TaxID=1679083 RepID=A0A3N6LTP1_NATCH|nr:response regulator [Natrarchaeobius chitinivorans]RQG93473.1 response regulator [Natrarchaeobius chitinivorans]